tara:strand:+ start:3334 stop:3774 length:441 start_codon:yes stop_codon:yes gene_type:complete
MIRALQTQLILYIGLLLSLIIFSSALGMHIGSSLSSPQFQTLTIEDPSSSTLHPMGTPHSEAGFTGFETGGITGEVITSGELTEIVSNETPAKIFFNTNGRESTIEYQGIDRFFVIEKNKTLIIGERIIIKMKRDSPQAILRITLP